MKRVQGSFFTGYVTVEVRGEHPERFFQLCMDELQIVVWDIQRESLTSCKGKMRLRDIKHIRHIRKNTHYKITFIERSGYPFIWRQWMKKKHIVLSVVLSFFLVFALSNIIWSIQVTGVSSDVEEKIIQALHDEQVKKGNWMFSVGTPSHIQHTLMEEVPELLWVGVEKKGTSFLLEGIEKKRVELIEDEAPRNLIASKKGVITYMHVSKGEPLVRVNDAVEKGDILVSGLIERADEDDEERTTVVSEGEVIAETWYEVDVTVPLESRIEKVTGEQMNRWYVHVASLPIRLWGWKDPPYEDVFIEEDQQPLYFLQWKTPFSISKITMHEKRPITETYTKDEAILIAIEQVHKDIRMQLGQGAIIKDEKVLHETEESGKVSVQLLITVEEDIVDTEPLLQGD